MNCRQAALKPFITVYKRINHKIHKRIPDFSFNRPSEQTMKYTAALLTFLLTACMNPNDAFFQNRHYQMPEAQLNGSNAVFHYGYSQNPDHDLLVDQVRVPDAYRASFARDWIAKEQGYRGMNKPNQEELTKLVADLNKFYP
ncbi:predicted protein [Neisseria gonorrhoeae PID1]|nr:predicted protein [Neisseria gonorrhoeae PID1]